MKEFFFTISLLIYSASTVGCPWGCLCQNTTIRCERNSLKDAIPPGILEANLVDFKPERIVKWPPIHDSWTSVTKLEITLKTPVFVGYLANRCFVGLTNLTFLGIHGINPGGVHMLIKKFSLRTKTFFGLNNLKTLDLSGNPSLRLSEVTKSMKLNYLLPNLKVINLKDLHDSNSKVQTDFFKVIGNRKIEKLILDGTEIKTVPSSICKHLIVLSLRSTVFTGSITQCPSLKELDLTNTNPFVVHEAFGFLPEIPDLMAIRFETFLFSVETLTLTNIYKNKYSRQVPLSFDYRQVVDMTGVFFKVKYLNFRKNFLKNFNVSLQNMTFPEGSEIDVSDNNIEYIHPKSLDPGKAIRKINLGGNKLHKMEKDYPAVFSVFLHIFTNLEEINLSNNKIKSLPRNILSNNLYLKSLNVSSNMIYTLSFDISPHSNLQYLDISENRLTSLSNKNMADLEKHASDFRTFAGKDNSIQNKSFVLYIFQNNFICDCENISFISWFKWAPFISEKHQHYCTYDDKKYALKGNAYEEIANDCKLRVLKRNLIIGGTSSVFLIFLTIISTVSFQRYRKKRNKIKSFLRNLRNKDANHFLAFLSFCSEDMDFVLSHLANELNNEVCLKTKRKAEYICIGDKHFRPGFPVITEIMSKMENSAVAIFVISQIFCKREWCHIEVQEAMELQKPVVLIFREEVDEQDMPKLIKKLFRQNTRCKFVQESNGQWTLQPSWEVMTSSIIELAAESCSKSLDLQFI